jgi:hypothetical protein
MTCTARCGEDEYPVNGTCLRGAPARVDETSVYCFSISDSDPALQARAICAKK